MQGTKWPRKQIGIKLDMGLWRDIKIVALEQDRTATGVVEDALREYTARHRENITKQEFGKRLRASTPTLPEKTDEGNNPAPINDPESDLGN